MVKQAVKFVIGLFTDQGLKAQGLRGQGLKAVCVKLTLATLIGFLLVLPISLYAQSKNALSDMSKGNLKAPIEVVQYASATCSHCAHWHNTVWPEFEKKYVKTGKVRFTFREVATEPANLAFGVYMIGRCAAAKPPARMTPSVAYFTVVDGFFADQAKVFESGDALPELKALSAKVGMDDKAMQACLNDQALFEKIRDKMETGMKAGEVESTPTFFVNGVRMNGTADLKDFDVAITAAKKTKP